MFSKPLGFIGIGLFIAAMFCLVMITFIEHIIPYFGECMIYTKREVCILGPFTVISKEAIQ